MHEKKRNRARLSGLLLVLVAALLGLVAVLNRQLIIDYVKSAQYAPSAEVASIRANLDLTSQGELYFNASETKLETAADFNQSCRQAKETNNPIMGCYVAQRIFIYDIDTSKLEGIEETTAAHELLHAAYERLGDDEKRTINSELQAAYEKLKTKDLQERMQYYRKTEPGEELNELHSILGTEFSNLGTTLERHYERIFNDRSKILKYFNQYNSVFESVSSRLKSLSAEINSRTEVVNARITEYNQDAKRFERDVKALNNKQFDSYNEYQAERSALLSRQSDLDRDRASINSEITAINILRTQYNLLVEEYNQLNVSINSTLTPVKSLSQ